MANAIPPPVGVKERVLSALFVDQTPEAPIIPLPGTAAEIPTATTEDTAAPVIPQAPTSTVKRLRTWKYLAAASIILFIVSGAVNLYLYNQYSEKNEQYISLLNDRNTLQANNDIYQTTIRDLQTANAMMTDPAMAKINMAGVKNAQDAAMVLWDTRSKDVYLVNNKLPTPARGKQYQLWAIVDGKPVDAGMVDENCNTICKLKNIPQAQAFAITLENLGGSPSPTIEEMYVMGKI
nr:anti-sigma factor [Aridibaculum aurantiacum]